MQTNPCRDRRLLNGLWRFQPDPREECESDGRTSVDYPIEQWPEAPVPTTVRGALPDLDFYQDKMGERSWFARSFDVPDHWQGRHVVLRMEGVNPRCKVWLNGALLGTHDDGFIPLSFPVTGRLRWGGTNRLVVLVDGEERAEDVPGPTTGWFPFRGILRDVSLTAMHPVRVERVRIEAAPRPGGGVLDIGWELVNGDDGPVRCRCEIDVRDAEGNVVASFSAESTVPGRTSTPLRIRGEVEGVRPWSPDDPALYTVGIALHAHGACRDYVGTRIGFRTVGVRDGRLLLNGTPLFLKGFNRHEDSAQRNMCCDTATARQDLLDMKSMGCNCVRLCHYPHDPSTVALCDEIGLLAKCEIPLYWWKGDEEGEGVTARRLEAAKRQLTGMVERDANHPSIIIWSVSNETHEDRAEVADGNAALVRHVRTLDATRPVTHASDHWFWERGLDDFREDDLVCLNTYPVWFHAPKFRPEQTREVSRWMADRLADIRDRYPGKPVLMAEFGFPAVRGLHSGLYSEESQSMVIEALFTGMRQAPNVCGACVWCYADHAWRNGRTSPFGVVSRDRTVRKAAYDTIKALFSAPMEQETS